MGHFYTYLNASLPALQWGAKPPFSYARFLEMCQGLVPEGDLAVLAALSLDSIAENDLSGQPTLRRLHGCENALRNELVRLRSSRRKIEPQKYLRGEGGDSAMHHSALAAFRSASLLEAEKILDKQRWDCADEAAAGHYFDLDQLIVFAYKLLLLLKWDAAGHARAEEAVDKVLA